MTNTKIQDMIEYALDRQEKNLDEKRSKLLLREYGIPVVEERLAYGKKDLLQIAQEIGYPVVIKAFGPELTHKSDLGAVYLDLQNQEGLQKAYTAIEQKLGNKMQAVLVQKQVQGKREFLVGLFRDPQFGAVVMFGLGGIYTEALADVSMRIAPLSRQDAKDMLEELRSREILNECRGEKRAKREEIIKTLLAVSQIGMDYPEIAEIDINPLVISPLGDVQAVDSLVVLQKNREDENAFPAIPSQALSELFHPQSVAMLLCLRTRLPELEEKKLNLIDYDKKV